MTGAVQHIHGIKRQLFIAKEKGPWNSKDKYYLEKNKKNYAIRGQWTFKSMFL